MVVEEKLKELGLSLPPPAEPSFQYVPVTIDAGVAYVSGQLPKENGEVRITGKVGDAVDAEAAQRAARICILQGLSCLKAAIGSLDNVERILKVTGFVASAPGFIQQPRVIDAASNSSFRTYSVNVVDTRGLQLVCPNCRATRPSKLKWL